MSIIDFANVSLTMPRTKRRKGSGRKQRLRRFAGETSRSMVPVIEDVSFTVNKGDSVAIVSGKPILRTALIRLAAGTLIPDTGTVTRLAPVVPMISRKTFCQVIRIKLIFSLNNIFSFLDFR